jgi:hypothetical protein
MPSCAEPSRREVVTLSVALRLLICDLAVVDGPMLGRLLLL